MATVAKNSFRFSSSSALIGLTGKKARHLKDFVEILKIIDGSSIFCHTHEAFREFHFAKGVFTNDFAYWVADSVHEDALAERLAGIDIRDFVDMKTLRKKLVDLVEDYLKQANDITIAPRGKEFYFCTAKSIAMKTKYEAWTLSEFKHALKKVGARSIFYHFFDARLRLGRKTNDFSYWIESSLGKPELAKKIEKLDPYLFTLGGLTRKIIEILEEEEKLDTIEDILKDKTLGLFRKTKKFLSEVRKKPFGEKFNFGRRVLAKMFKNKEKK